VACRKGGFGRPFLSPNQLLPGTFIVADKPIVLSTHVQHSAAERKIAEEWIAQVVRNPVTRKPDPTRPGATRAFGPIAAFGNRMLRVVYYDVETEYQVVTVFFDRRATRRRRNP